jgi:hypothetical protein
VGMHDAAYELPRNPIPRTSVNRCRKEGQGCYYAPALLMLLDGYPLHD